MSTAATLETLINQGIKESGKTPEEVAEEAGVSRATLFRIKGGKTQKGYTTEECLVQLVEQGIISPEALRVHCWERCAIGKAREKYKVKGKRKRPQFRGLLQKILRKLYTKARQGASEEG